MKHPVRVLFLALVAASLVAADVFVREGVNPFRGGASLAAIPIAVLACTLEADVSARTVLVVRWFNVILFGGMALSVFAAVGGFAILSADPFGLFALLVGLFFGSFPAAVAVIAFVTGRGGEARPATEERPPRSRKRVLIAAGALGTTLLGLASLASVKDCARQSQRESAMKTAWEKHPRAHASGVGFPGDEGTIARLVPLDDGSVVTLAVAPGEAVAKRWSLQPEDKNAERRMVRFGDGTVIVDAVLDGGALRVTQASGRSSTLAPPSLDVVAEVTFAGEDPLLGTAPAKLPVTSPDGRRSVILTSGRIRLIDSTNGTLFADRANRRRDAAAAVFSPDSSWVAILDGFELHLLRSEDGVGRAWKPLSQPELVAFSVDGEHVVVASAGAVTVLPVRDADRQWSLRAARFDEYVAWISRSTKRR